jgi:CheY-like chemotaxis protein
MSATDAASVPLPRRGKVLVVEDIALIRMATMDMLEQIGFPALEAGDGPEALALLKSDPEIEILFTDLGLPGMSGHELVDEARRLKPGLKVIIASGYSTETGAKPEAADIIRITKPYDLNQLRKALGA